MDSTLVAFEKFLLNHPDPETAARIETAWEYLKEKVGSTLMPPRVSRKEMRWNGPTSYASIEILPNGYAWIDCNGQDPLKGEEAVLGSLKDLSPRMISVLFSFCVDQD